MRLASLALAAVALLSGCAEDGAVPTGSTSTGDRGVIRGTVVQLGTLRSLADTRITVEPGAREATTDAAGRYVIDELSIPSGGLEYRVRADKPGFGAVEGSTVLSPSRPEATVNFQLTAQTSSVSGTTR